MHQKLQKTEAGRGFFSRSELDRCRILRSGFVGIAAPSPLHQSILYFLLRTRVLNDI